MPWNELLYERQLKRPLDEETRRAIDAEYHQRRHQIPIPTEFRWHSTRTEFTIRSTHLSFIVRFTHDHRMIVNAELSLAAKLMATDKNRREAVKFIESIATDVGL